MRRRIEPLAVSAYTATTAAGAGRGALHAALSERRSGLRRNDFGPQLLPTWIGRVQGLEDAPLPARFAGWECRNNRLAWLALQQDGFLDAARAAITRHGADRVALVVGTSTSSIGASEEAYARLDEGRFPADLARPIVHTPHSLGDFLQHVLGVRGPALTVATACSSSAKVFAQAARLLEAGFADAAIVGGVDTLCGSVLFGFNSLGLVSPEPCRPFDAARRGLSLGEAGGFALLERRPRAPLQLEGYGESSDAHHMSAPHPEGRGARQAMQDALARAGRSPDQVDYINLHGTATPKNDEVEAGAVASLFPASTRASSTKGWTGHTLGAAGIVESAIALLALEHGLVPGTLNCGSPDPACGPQIATGNEVRPLRVAMNNSFGFGGNNCSLLFARGDGARMSGAGAGSAATGSRATGGASTARVEAAGTESGIAPRRRAPACVRVEGLGFWASGLPGLDALRSFLAGGAELGQGPAKPSPQLLPANERRRAPDSVALALEVAQAACAAAGRDPATLPSVFASTHGDLAITDYMCQTLAEAPAQISPTRFHNSVHNAAAGYWTIGTGCHAPATALSAYRATFAQGLLEAVAQVLSEQAPVLLVAYDCASRGPLAAVSCSAGLLGAALVLAPEDGASGVRLSLSLDEGDAPAPDDALSRRCAANAMAPMLPLVALLAEGRQGIAMLDAGGGHHLRVEVQP